MFQRRFWISLPILGLVCLFLAPATASAFGGFEFSVTSMNATTASVRIDLRSYYTLDGPCTPTHSCLNIVDFVRVTPCPPGVPCVNGTHEIQLVNDSWFATFALNYGVTYTFTGTRELRWGQGPSSACQTTCVVTTVIPTAVFTVPAADLPHMDIVPISSENGTVWVDVVIANTSTKESDCWKSTYCPRETMFYQVTPCPLAIEGEENADYYCHGGTMSYLDESGSQHRQFALQAGLTYTFAGSAGVEGYSREMSGACVERRCGYSEVIPSKTFTASTVAIDAVSWGHVKSLYRSP